MCFFLDGYILGIVHCGLILKPPKMINEIIKKNDGITLEL
jgi:hypothetical protein